MKLYDHVLVEEWFPLMSRTEGEETKAAELPELERARVFDINNVIESLRGQTDHGPILGRRIAIPPETDLWFEYRHRAKRPDDPAELARMAVESGFVTEFGFFARFIDTEAAGIEVPGARWWIAITDYIRRKVEGRYRILGPCFNCAVMTDDAGIVVGAEIHPYIDSRWKHTAREVRGNKPTIAVYEPIFATLLKFEEGGAIEFHEGRGCPWSEVTL